MPFERAGENLLQQRMTNLKYMIRGALVAGILSVSSLSAAIVTEITLGDFTAPNILDFESAAVGNVSGTESMFTDIGIASVSGTAGSYTDDFQDRDNSSERALWFTSGNQLVIVDPGNSGSAQYGQQNISYEISFTNSIFRFGFSTHDEPFAAAGAAPLNIRFYSGATQVGSITSNGVLLAGTGPNPNWDRRDFYFGNDELFDRVVLTTDPNGNQGFALDNFAVDPALSDVPEPGSLALFGLGLMGAAFMRRKQQNR